MITRKFNKVLKILSEKLNRIDYVIVGSTNLALQGVNVKPKDVDILTDKKGAYSINERLKEYETLNVEWRKSKRFNSYFGKFNINGVEVEVMGELHNNIPPVEVWKDFDKNKVKIKINNSFIYGISLEKELQAYTVMKKKKLKQLKEFLKI